MQVEELTTANGQVMEGPLLMTPQVCRDDRGLFLGSWNQRRLDGAVGSPIPFLQDKHSRSSRGELRGLDFQLEPEPQGKLMRCPARAGFDVAEDLRGSLPTFGQWGAAELSGDNRRQLWAPAGFAHGFLTLSSSADVVYKTSGYWSKSFERSLRWNDPQLAIAWPLAQLGIHEPLRAGKDAAAPSLAQMIPAEGGVHMKVVLTGGDGQLGHDLRQLLQALS